ncbi:MAG: thiamine phosphate synthase [Proteobacteria bacterium]|nr:thiamine phosphate synthase [Pseudomonadota bacterium]
MTPNVWTTAGSDPRGCVGSVVTLSIPETEQLLKKRLNTYQDIEKAAEEILSLGVKSVLIKGDHFNYDILNQDYWTNGAESFWLANHRYSNKNYPETGKVFSAAIATYLALGYDIKDAIVIAKMYVNQGIDLAEKENASNIKQGGWPESQAYLPYLSSQPLHTLPKAFADLNNEKLGLYPVVDNFTWVQKLLSTGIKTIQLRIKNKTGSELEHEIIKSIEISNKYGAKLFVNDYWQIAIRHGAYGVHLGQSDINSADIQRILEAGLRLGISTHSYYEVARAHALHPSYMACGPIFHTTSKIMPFAPQGLSQLKRWRRTLDYPLVAIGGINLARLPAVLETKIDGISLITDITQAQDPIERAKQLLNMVNQYVINAQ